MSHVPPVTMSSATVMQHNLQFAGDHRFLPGLQPINKDTSRPDLTVVINKAFTAWGDDIPIPALEAIDLAASSNAIRRLLLSPPASVDPICLEQLEPFTDMDPTLALSRKESCILSGSRTYSPVNRLQGCSPDNPQKVCLLPKRGMNHRLGGVLAGVALPSKKIKLQDS